VATAGSFPIDTGKNGSGADQRRPTLRSATLVADHRRGQAGVPARPA
jgi:hypothetical protein